MEKTRKCKSCGKEMPKKAKFCNECGAKFKKPFYTRWWFWVIAVVLFIGIVGAASEGNENPEAVGNQPTASAPATSTPKPTETPKPTPTPTPSPTVEPSEDKEAYLDTLCSLIELALRGKFSGYTVTHYEEIITVSVWSDGVAAAVDAGGQEAEEAWEVVKENMVAFSDSIHGFIDDADGEDVYIMLNVLNDANLENTLLSIYEGIIIYDAMED